MSLHQLKSASNVRFEVKLSYVRLNYLSISYQKISLKGQEFHKVFRCMEGYRRNPMYNVSIMTENSDKIIDNSIFSRL